MDFREMDFEKARYLAEKAARKAQSCASEQGMNRTLSAATVAWASVATAWAAVADLYPYPETQLKVVDDLQQNEYAKQVDPLGIKQNIDPPTTTKFWSYSHMSGEEPVQGDEMTL